MPDQTMAQVFRSYAAKEEVYAAEARLDNVRVMHKSAARKWIALAERSERFDRVQRLAHEEIK